MFGRVAIDLMLISKIYKTIPVRFKLVRNFQLDISFGKRVNRLLERSSSSRLARSAIGMTRDSKSSILLT